VQVVDIGLPKDAERDVPVELLDARWVRERLPARPRDGNKGTFGRVYVVAGSVLFPGAARLACEAAYRSGAGLVELSCSPHVQTIVASAVPEVVYSPLHYQVGLEDVDMNVVMGRGAGADCVLFGPGIGADPGNTGRLLDFLQFGELKRCVIDADGLNALARDTTWTTYAKCPLVLTPHPGEMSRLLGCSVDDVQRDRLNIATNAAKEWGHVVVLKGAHTIVAAPDGRAAISPHANPLLATAGTGDVLAGAIAGFIAQGAAPFDAAACAVFVHGLAAEELAEDLGDRGMLASDLFPALPRAIRTIREGKRPRMDAQSPFAGMLGGLQGLGLPTAPEIT
jgi:NAD(P)H-hydrate epimerase